MHSLISEYVSEAIPPPGAIETPLPPSLVVLEKGETPRPPLVLEKEETPGPLLVLENGETPARASRQAVPVIAATDATPRRPAPLRVPTEAPPMRHSSPAGAGAAAQLSAARHLSEMRAEQSVDSDSRRSSISFGSGQTRLPQRIATELTRGSM